MEGALLAVMAAAGVFVKGRQWNSLRHGLVHERGVQPTNGSRQAFVGHGCEVCRRDSQSVYKHMP